MLEEVADPLDALGVEAVDRFVEDHRLGISEQCGGDTEPLTHPEREAADALSCHVLEAHPLDQLVDTLLGNAMGLAEREQVVVGRASGMNRTRFEQRAYLVEGRRMVSIRFRR